MPRLSVRSFPPASLPLSTTLESRLVVNSGDKSKSPARNVSSSRDIIHMPKILINEHPPNMTKNNGSDEHVLKSTEKSEPSHHDQNHTRKEVDERGLTPAEHPIDPKLVGSEADESYDTFHNVPLSTQKPLSSRPSTPHSPQTSNIPRQSPSSTKTTPVRPKSLRHSLPKASEWSHQILVPENEPELEADEPEWQAMPAYAPFDMYNDDNKLVAREGTGDEDEDAQRVGHHGGATKGYTRVQMDDDAQSATSLDDDTAYLFKGAGAKPNVLEEEDNEERDMVTQMQTTKTLLTESQRIAYVGLVKLAANQMIQNLTQFRANRSTKRSMNIVIDHMIMWSQMIMIRMYSHMDIPAAEQVMIERLSDEEHGVQPQHLVPSLMQNARIRNPMQDPSSTFLPSSTSSAHPTSPQSNLDSKLDFEKDKHNDEKDSDIKSLSDIATKPSLNIDIRWTVLCDLFLILISDSTYDARSRQLLEIVASHLEIDWLDVCRFEKRIVEALEVQEAADKENWNEDEHMEKRRKGALRKRYMVMGMATVGGGLIIGLSMGLLAPVIGAGLAAGFTTFGVTGTSSFLAGTGGAAIITTTGVISGSNVGFKASERRTGAVKTFEYRPLHNNKRPNLIVTVAGWLTGNMDDVRLPFSTVEPIMGDIYSVFWEPEILKSMGDTINILATEALTQALQQILGSTILTALMAAIQLPIVLTKLAYLIDNPWTVSLARADLAGLILADSLIDRNLGQRPITLVGFSLGARVIYSCMKELAKKHKIGLIQNVYMFGSPVVVSNDEYTKIRSIVPGRFVNGYARNDWILGYLFRATSGGIMRVAGLAPIEIPTIENVNVTEQVPGHMSYRKAMPRLLRELGWIVESDEFSEIEDPDPENHGKRQRELINEIEEARKHLVAEEEKGSKKKSWWNFARKSAKERKLWEVYEEDNTLKLGNASTIEKGDDDLPTQIENKAGSVSFDVDALRSEVADLAAQGIIVKELPESTLPPIRIQLSNLPEQGSIAKGISEVVEPSANLTQTPQVQLVEQEQEQLVQHLRKLDVNTPTTPSHNDGIILVQNSGHHQQQDQELADPNHNAWAEEFGEGVGKEQEVQMVFE